MHRRDFIKIGCGLCATGLLLNSLSGCTPTQQVFKSDINDRKIIVPNSLFAQSTLVLVRIKKLQYDIALRQLPDKTYTAILLRCSHFANPLDVSAKGFTCSLHGSTFTPEGIVKKGPAELPLKSFPVTIENNNIIIHTGFVA